MKNFNTYPGSELTGRDAETKWLFSYWTKAGSEATVCIRAQMALLIYSSLLIKAFYFYHYKYTFTPQRLLQFQPRGRIRRLLYFKLPVWMVHIYESEYSDSNNKDEWLALFLIQSSLLGMMTIYIIVHTGDQKCQKWHWIGIVHLVFHPNQT